MTTVRDRLRALMDAISESQIRSQVFNVPRNQAGKNTLVDWQDGSEAGF